MNRIPFAALLLLLTAAAAQAQAPFDPAARAATIAPLIDAQTVAVARLNIDRIDATALVKLAGEIVPTNQDAPSGVAQMEVVLKTALAALRGAGIREIYTVVSLADVPGQPLVAAPLAGNADPTMAAEILRTLTRLPAARSIGKLVVAGSAETLQRLEKLQPVARPELVSAFGQAGDSAVQAILCPNADTRRVLREMLPRLPDEIGGGSGKMLADVNWAVLSVESPPKLALHLTVQSRDADAASALRGLVVSGLQLLGKQEQVQKELPKFDELARLLTPQIKGDRLTLELTSDNGGATQAIALLTRPLQAARTAAGRSQSMNHLKQIMLAMFNYHDTHLAFPPQAIRSQDGKPLLSWRVALLPYIEANDLYKQFHLDEPWDSAHNKPLIEKMPAVFASPHLGDVLRAKGLTSYLAPLSKQPPAVFVAPKRVRQGTELVEDEPADAAPAVRMVFDVPQGPPMRLIIDGTSNTIAIVEVHPKNAVIWTKPDDLLIDPKDPTARLRGQPSDGFNAAICDGSIRFIKATIDIKTLMRLFQMDDGEPIGEF